MSTVEEIQAVNAERNDTMARLADAGLPVTDPDALRRILDALRAASCDSETCPPFSSSKQEHAYNAGLLKALDTLAAL